MIDMPLRSFLESFGQKNGIGAKSNERCLANIIDRDAQRFGEGGTRLFRIHHIARRRPRVQADTQQTGTHL